PFFLGSSALFRTRVLGAAGHVQLFVDLGDGVLEATVETAAYVLTTRRASPAAVVFRLLIESDKEAILQQLIAAFLTGSTSDKTFFVHAHDFALLRGSPSGVWAPNPPLQRLGARAPIEGILRSIRVGLQRSDDFGFLRLLGEVPATEVVLGRVADPNDSIREACLYALNNGRGWAPFSKTEVAVPWYSPITLVVNWKSSGREVKAFAIGKGYSPSRNVRSEDDYFEPGFSYMLRSTRLVPYLVPRGVIPTAGRAQIFPQRDREYDVLGICASNVGSAVARFSGEWFARPKFQASM